MTKVVGIDLGTTNSCVSVIKGGTPTVIANAEGFRTTPSVVAYTKTKDQLVRQIAKRQAVMNSENTFESVKRFIGRRSDEVIDETKDVPYSIESLGTKVKIKSPVLEKLFSPEEISASVLRKLADDASKYLGQPVTQAVVTVPAYQGSQLWDPRKVSSTKSLALWSFRPIWSRKPPRSRSRIDSSAWTSA